MQTLIISDTTCLVILDKIGAFAILHKLFQKITITSLIAQEFKKPLPHWISINDPLNSAYLEDISKIVDPGEASAIALSKEIKNCLLILDDLKARQLADELKLKYTGTIGILLLAKRRGYFEDFNAIINRIQETNFRLSNALIQKLKEDN
ncbi:MAG: hypothetical protein RLZZ543_803 [Bacteroidota bacterium]|jgi:predicted nucleic acid-binding protein